MNWKKVVHHALLLSSLVVLILGFISRCILRSGRTIPSQESDEVEIVTVYDGDTLKVGFEGGEERRVRLIGVDCPEMGDDREEVHLQAFWAKRFAFYHLYGEKVRITYDREREDKYGRILAYVWLEDDLLFNRFMIEEGFSPAFTRYPFRQDYRTAFTLAERSARRKKKGLWSDRPFPLISPEETESHLGHLVRVRFVCEDIRKARNFNFLQTPDGRFAALIPDPSLKVFPDPSTYLGNKLVVEGFLEEFRGQAQVMIESSDRLVIEKSKPEKGWIDLKTRPHFRANSSFGQRLSYKGIGHPLS